LTFAWGAAVLGIEAYQFQPAKAYWDSGNGSGQVNALTYWYVATAVGISAGCTLIVGSILCLVYNLVEADGLKFPAAIVVWLGALCCVPSCVLNAMTLNTMVQAAGGIGFTGLCYTQYCSLDYYTGVAVCLLGISFFLGFCTGLSTLLTH